MLRFLRPRAGTIVYRVGGDPPTHGPYRMHLGALVVDLEPDGRVHLVSPVVVEGVLREYPSLRAFLRAMRSRWDATKGGA